MRSLWLVAMTLVTGCTADRTASHRAAAARIPAGEAMLAPAGFLALCERGDPACSGLETGPATIDGVVTRKTLDRVNRLVNARVRRVPDSRAFGEREFWVRSGVGKGASGDCEDMALEKRARLLEAGIPASAMALAVVFHPRAGRHAVLVIRSAESDLVLDSRSPYIHAWHDTPYRWLSVQTNGRDPLLWARVTNSNDTRTARRTSVADITAALR